MCGNATPSSCRATSFPSIWRRRTTWSSAMATKTTTSTDRQTKRGSRQLSRSDRRFKQFSIHKQENFEEVGSIGDWLRSHGWEKDEAANHWTIEVADALSVPNAPFGIVKSRGVADSKSGHIVGTVLPSPTTRPEQVHRSFKSARSVHVVMEVYEKSGEESIPWEDQEMLPEDQTRSGHWLVRSQQSHRVQRIRLGRML